MEQNKEDSRWPFHSYFEIYSKAQKKVFRYYLGFKKETTSKKKPQKTNNKFHRIKIHLNRTSLCFREWNDTEQLTIVQVFANNDIYSIINTIIL